MAPRDRKELGQILKHIPGVESIYFQKPSNTRMIFPCIIYEHSSSDTQFADNVPYVFLKRYTVTVIDSNPDSKIPDEISKLPRCVSDRNFVSDNLHHWVFILYF